MNELKELFFEFLKEITESLTGAVNMGLNSAAGFHDRLDWVLAFIFVNFSTYTANKELAYYAPQAEAWERKMAEKKDKELIDPDEEEIIVAEEDEELADELVIEEDVAGEAAQAVAAAETSPAAGPISVGLSIPFNLDLATPTTQVPESEVGSYVGSSYEVDQTQNVAEMTATVPAVPAVNGDTVRVIHGDTMLSNFNLDDLFASSFPGGNLSFSFSSRDLPPGFSTSDFNTIMDAGRSGSNALSVLDLGSIVPVTVAVMQGGASVGTAVVEFLNYRLDFDADENNARNNAGREINSGSDMGQVTTATFNPNDSAIHIHNTNFEDLLSICELMDWDLQVINGANRFVLTVGFSTSGAQSSSAWFDADTLDPATSAAGSTAFTLRLSSSDTKAESAMTTFNGLLLNDLANTWVGGVNDGIDAVFAFDGANTLYGNARGSDISTDLQADGSEVLTGGDQDDTIFGDVGDSDRILAGGRGGDDVLRGKGGSDVLIGDSMDDILGAGGDDILIGGDGDDFLYSDNSHFDTLGTKGINTIQGGRGDDMIVGGAHAKAISDGDFLDASNVYEYDLLINNGTDTIQSFVLSSNATLVSSPIGMIPFSTAQGYFTFFNATGETISHLADILDFTLSGGDHRLILNNGSTGLVDIEGSGASIESYWSVINDGSSGTFFESRVGTAGADMFTDASSTSQILDGLGGGDTYKFDVEPTVAGVFNSLGTSVIRNFDATMSVNLDYTSLVTVADITAVGDSLVDIDDNGVNEAQLFFYANMANRLADAGDGTIDGNSLGTSVAQGSVIFTEVDIVNGATEVVDYVSLAGVISVV